MQLWRTPVLIPFKLITVYLHEVSHALAAKCTCGKVSAGFGGLGSPLNSLLLPLCTFCHQLVLEVLWPLIQTASFSPSMSDEQ